MAPGKKKGKKKPPGGASGAPPRSEPRVQIFSKFAGCNFQLANRNFDDLFDSEEAESQTDLMPMLMAVQNNAGIAPFGGIETRQNIVKLFDAPAGKKLTGVATLINDWLYAACDDQTIHHNALGATPNLSAEPLLIVDNNGTYKDPVAYNYPGASSVWYGPEVPAVTQATSTQIIGPDVGQYQTFTVLQSGLLSAVSIHYKEVARAAISILRGSTVIGTVDRDLYVPQVRTSFTGLLRLAIPEEPVVAAGEVLKIRIDSDAMVGIYHQPVSAYAGGAWSAGGDIRFATHERPIGSTFTVTHELTRAGVLAKARYQVAYPDGIARDARVRVYHAGSLVFEGDRQSGIDIELRRQTEVGDLVTMVVETAKPITGASYVADFYEADDDNTWTCLGYADDHLVGMTANNQIWTGLNAHFVLENAAKLADPDPLVDSDLVPVGAVTIHPDYHAEGLEQHRQTISYTLLNKFGPTLTSDPLTFYSSMPWNLWSSADFIKVSGTAPNLVGVTAVELYFTDGENQEPALLGRVNIPEITTFEEPAVAPPATKPWSFNWGQIDTSAWVKASLSAPTQNYTTGVPASKMAALDGQLYFWGGTEPHRIWIGGGPGNRFSVSPGTGGGFVDTEPGTGTIVRDVLKFKTQQGAAIVTALCDNPNSQRESRFNLVESTLSLSDTQSTKGWMAEKIAGTVGCKSSRGAVVGGDGLYTVSRYGLAITTLTMEYNSQLQVMYISDPIAPVFLKLFGQQLEASVLFAVNGVLYMTFGTGDGSPGSKALDNIIFCYDIALKAWWTYTLETESPILNMIHIDYENWREGIGIITADGVYLLPTTMDEGLDVLPVHEVLIESGELTTMQPIQSMHHLSQLEFRFDYFIGDLDIDVTMIDQFGREITTTRTVTTKQADGSYTRERQLAVYLRIDQVVESYKVVLRGRAKMRLTHFIAKLYPKPMRIGMAWGFDSQQGDSHGRSIHRTFASYNDVKDAIIP